ncbi:MAG: heavy metal translocating P-type ATPase [Flavobacteriales bacterium CG_4_10_14_0_2_um_filter_32_8]|nr:MAG: heavy metal translocating P-type ATPase [Flavobacteriales bacterium CG_4_10_14_0_2_um_filter_32_8]PJB15695.1 MAG: heavy metal translocating P-type ATPase [Flavobacteriales bacterium CG_4_9_14_3_um_filter_32_8]
MQNHEICYHCGENCEDELIKFDTKKFCCLGCKTVYEILNQNNLCNYYELESTPGISPPKDTNKKFEYLENTKVIDKLLDYQDDQTSIINLYLPQIHCSSCIWLLENLYKLNIHIKSSRVNFLKKELKISFNHNNLSLRKLVELLASIGYNPTINLDQLKANKKKLIDHSLIYKLGIAGFCFGNIMLISLPEYFGLDAIKESAFSQFFGYINMVLSLPIILYSSSGYLKSAYQAVIHKTINIDIPITLGILALFFRSIYEILSHTGSGYLDSLAALIFFMLIGRIFQQKTYDILSFERDYKSYFPIATTIVTADKIEKSIYVSELTIGDMILIRNNEIIPVDAILISGEANIDNSFVTGEANPIFKKNGDKIYAGGKQLGQAIQLQVIKKLSYSYLTQLWNDEAFTKADEDKFDGIMNKISKYFTIIILFIAIGSLAYWWKIDAKIAINSFTAVLIIACPCALALSAPFTFGNVLRILGKNKFYLKNASVIERLAKINTIVFDKTGTITQSSKNNVTYYGTPLTEEQKIQIASVLRQSSHPLSKLVFNYIDAKKNVEIDSFKELLGQGLVATINDIKIQLGSEKFIKNYIENLSTATRVHLKINESYLGYFQIENSYRTGLSSIIAELKSFFKINLISGDNNSELENLKSYFGVDAEFLFNKTPEDKLAYIKSLQQKGNVTLMIGDGLNDAGALKQSDVGISISEDVNTFSPACDAILDASVFDKLPQFILYCKSSINIIIASFIISFSYNIIGLYFAVTGLLSPVFAAILMPLSSITVVVFVTLTSNLLAQHKKL